jgi:hypothetical protein
MLNQVKLEGILVSRWEYKGEAFLRLAHHQRHRKGEVIHSDYVTARVDPMFKELPQLHQGDLVRVQGEVRGKDILESLGRVLQKARLNVELTPELERLIVPRPTTYIFARTVSLVDNKAEAYAIGAKVAGRPVQLHSKPDLEPEKAEVVVHGFNEVT